ncbi:MAG: TonB C-terminal domain-containing protein [Alphaproteobacteria bacterium]|nr:TonB C-terminal domain-containing protein [Alphaproteobacteria bacterium]
MAHPASLLLAVLLGAPAHADDAPAAGDLDTLLNSIPTIENPDAPVQQDEPEPDPDVPLDVYGGQVRAQVLAAWKPSKGLIKKNPSIETRLVVSIADDGSFTGLKPLKLSGDKAYDDKCVKAINAVGTVAPPPPNLRPIVSQGLEIRFSGAEWLRAH